MEKAREQKQQGPSQERPEQEKKTTDLLAALCFTVALALLLTSAGATLAKYIRDTSSASMAVAAPFFFTSDSLSEGAAVPTRQITEPEEGENAEFEFTLSNFVDDLRRTKQTIEFGYKVYGGTDLTAQPVQSAAGLRLIPTDEAPRVTQTVSLAVPKSAFVNGTVTVVAESSDPYRKKLTGSFCYLPQSYREPLEVEDQGEAVILRFTAADTGSLSVTWPSALAPDPFNELFSEAQSNTASFATQAGVSYALSFLKENPAATFSAADFTVVPVSQGS